MRKVPDTPEPKPKRTSKGSGRHGFFNDPNDVGDTPAGFPPEFKDEWNTCKKMWPQLTLRDRHGLIQYITDLLIWKTAWKEIDDLGFTDPETGRATAAYVIYKDIGNRLHRYRNDIAGNAAFRGRAGDVEKKDRKEKEDAFSFD